MIMHIAPDLVKTAELESARDGGFVDLEGADRGVHGARTTFNSAESSGNGSYGDPTDATPEKGERIFEAACDHLVQLLEWLDDQPFEALMPADHVDPQPGSRR